MHAQLHTGMRRLTHTHNLHNCTKACMYYDSRNTFFMQQFKQKRKKKKKKKKKKKQLNKKREHRIKLQKVEEGRKGARSNIMRFDLPFDVK
jgi:hypothetical protein